MHVTLQQIVQVTGALGVLASFASFLLGVLGNRYPWALRAAMRMSDLGLRLHNVGNLLGSFLPGGQPPQLALMRSQAPRPSIVEMCPTCGAPCVAPAPVTLRTGEKP
jgi:hypothetical protein